MWTTKARLSTLWIILMFNYVYADVIGFFAPEMIEGILAGGFPGLRLTPTLLLGSALLMQPPIIMIYLSRALERNVNRIANIVLGTIYTGVNVVLNFLMASAAYAMLFGAVEVGITVLIVWYAWRWPRGDAREGEASLAPAGVNG